MEKIVISQAYVLYFLILLVLILVGTFLVRIIKRGSGGKIIVSFALHLLILAGALLSLSGLQIQKTFSEEGTEVYVLADVSYSGKEQLSQLDDTIANIEKNLDSQTKLGVICFGKDAKLTTKMGEKFVTVKHHTVDDSATNIAHALDYAEGLFSPKCAKRIVLLSDGKQTDGNCVAAAERLIQQNIHIDAYNFNEDIPTNPEIQMNDISYTKSVFLHQIEEVKVTVQSNFADHVSFTLYKNNEIFSTGLLDVTEGLNIIKFPLDTSTAGRMDYRIHVSSTLDTNERNNDLYFTQEIVEKPRILVISSKTQSKNLPFFEEIYGEDALLSHYDYHSRLNLDYLCQFDEVILNQLNLDDVEEAEQFSSDLDAFVSLYGKGVFSIGEISGEKDSSQAAMKRLEQILPIRFHPSTDSRVVVLIIDCSYSMAENERLVKAKEGAKKCVSSLDPNDYIMVESFCNEVRIVQPLTKASNYDAICAAIDSIELGPATYIGSSLATTFDQIQNLDFDSKQVILLSDGEPSEDDPVNPLRIVEEMSQEGIFTSVMNISSLDGVTLLNRLAEVGNGSYYQVNDLSDLENMMLQEIEDENIDAAIIQDCKIDIIQEQHESMQGVEYLPNIEGFYYTRVKGTAEIVMTTTYVNEAGGKRRCPIYASWNYGKGKVSSFATDLDSWASSWKQSSSAKIFFQNVSNDLQPKERIQTSLHLSFHNHGYTTTVQVGVVAPKENALMKATVISPNGTKETQVLIFSKAYYFGEFQTEESGNYELHLSYGNEADWMEIQQVFSFSYSAEYDHFDTRKEVLLYRIISSDGKVYQKDEALHHREQKVMTKTKDLSLIFLSVSLLLFVVDIAVRKIDITKRRKHHE